MDRIHEAMQQINRADFLPLTQRRYAGMDIPLSIGYRQTNSQPSTVRRMLKWLGVQQGDNILDIGSGSGWTTAILSQLTGEYGSVYAVELVPELVTIGRDNCAKYDIQNVSFHQAGDTLGLPEHAPYDRILVSASASSLPQTLLDQLASGGRMVIPIGDTIYEINKIDATTFDTVMHPGYAFVPLYDA